MLFRNYLYVLPEPTTFYITYVGLQNNRIGSRRELGACRRWRIRLNSPKGPYMWAKLHRRHHKRRHYSMPHVLLFALLENLRPRRHLLRKVQIRMRRVLVRTQIHGLRRRWQRALLASARYVRFRSLRALQMWGQQREMLSCAVPHSRSAHTSQAG